MWNKQRFQTDCCGDRPRHRNEGFREFMGRGGRGWGHGGRERMFDSGELRLVILALIAEKPSHGYELIKLVEERLGGGYAPSPGVVYPTLTLLEEEGLIAIASSDGPKKLYSVTPEGARTLEENAAAVKAIFERMKHAGERFGKGRSPQVMRAMMNLGMALRMRVGRGGLAPEQIEKITEALDNAARTIDGV